MPNEFFFPFLSESLAEEQRQEEKGSGNVCESAADSSVHFSPDLTADFAPDSSRLFSASESISISDSSDSVPSSISDSDEIESAVQRGLNHFRGMLSAGIMPGDGAFKKDCAVTALAGMAFLSSGSTPTEGPDAEYVQLCIKFILENRRKDGVLASASASEQGAAYAHGFAVTFLAECLGMSSNDAELRAILEKGILKIVEAQGENGGWRYSFLPGEEDVSVSACFLTALRACRNAGAAVPSETIQKGVEYLLRCQNEDGGFRYRLTEGPSAYPRSAAAIAGLCAAGTYQSPEIQKGLEYLQKFLLNPETLSEEDGYYFYAQYYAIQAFLLTEPMDAPANSGRNSSGELNSREFARLITRRLLSEQKPDGTWYSSISRDYATSMALITLLAQTNYLPIFQR